ncbi:MAG: hypothetical protein ACLR8Y_01180 [Alistipes indistinctus]
MTSSWAFLFPDQVYQLRGDAPVAEDADRKALSTLYGQLEYYIDRNFKFETAILQLAPADPRKGVQELYIHSGTYMGVKPGDLFMVYEEIPVGGSDYPAEGGQVTCERRG